MLSDFSTAVEYAQKVDAQLLSLCRRRVSLAVQRERLKPSNFSETELTERVAAVITRNVLSKRAAKVITHRWPPHLQPGSSDAVADLFQDTSHLPELESYIDRVTLHYLREHKRVSNLTAKGEQEWTDLYQQLARRAYKLLRRIGISHERALHEAKDFAQETCGILLRTSFPFDVPFEAWIARILSNNILRQYIRSNDVSDRVPEPLPLDKATEDVDGDDNHLGFTEQIENPSSSSHLERIETREQLCNAIAALDSIAQQQVIIGTYFYDLSDEDLARQLNKTVGAIYILRHRALKRLRGFLEESGDYALPLQHKITTRLQH